MITLPFPNTRYLGESGNPSDPASLTEQFDTGDGLITLSGRHRVKTARVGEVGTLTLSWDGYWQYTSWRAGTGE